jgi:hypothetical protein
MIHVLSVQLYNNHWDTSLTDFFVQVNHGDGLKLSCKSACEGELSEITCK